MIKFYIQTNFERPIALTCHYSCLTCSGEDYDNCLTCTTDSSHHRIASPISNECKCADGYYDSNSLTCSQCHISCKTCNGYSKKLSFLNEFNL